MIPLLGKSTVQVRRLAQTIVNHAPVITVEDTFELVASVQPLTGEELLRAPAGLSSEAGVKIYAPKSIELRISRAGATPTRGDLVQYGGIWYEIGNKRPWPVNSPQPHNYYEAFAPASGVALPGGA